MSKRFLSIASEARLVQHIGLATSCPTGLLFLAIPTVHAQEAASDAGVALEEVTVTATRREESLIRVPLSVTAMDNAKLDDLGVVSIDDLTRLTPGVSFSRSGYADTTDISIRGIASSVGTSTTGVYVDDIPVQVRSLGFAASNLYPANFDLARVEVLRGPQGTLFGAGSEGGTVRFILTPPSLTEYSGYARADYGFTDGGGDTQELGGAVGGPIVDEKLGFRASAWRRHTGGSIDRVSPIDGRLLQKEANERDEVSGRLAFTYAPTDAVRIGLSGFYQETKKQGGDSYYERLSSPSSGVFRSADPLGSPADEDFFVGALTVEADLTDALSLISVTSYLNRHHNPTQDYSHFMPTLILGPQIWDESLRLPFFPEYAISSRFNNTQNNFTQEVRLQTNDTESPWSGTVGVFYTYARQGSTQILFDPMLPEFTARLTGEAPVEAVFGAPMLNATDSYISKDTGLDKQTAIFGDVSYELTQEWKATVGARYGSAKFEYTNYQAGPWAGTTGAAARGEQEAHRPRMGQMPSAVWSTSFSTRTSRVSKRTCPAANRSAATTKNSRAHSRSVRAMRRAAAAIRRHPRFWLQTHR